MKILLVTETWDLTNGPYESLYPYMRSIFERMGHQVVAVDNKKNYLRLGGRTTWEVAGWMGRLRWLKINDLIVNSILRRVSLQFQPDLVLLMKCENIYYDTVIWLREHTSAVIFNWDHDNPFWPSNTSMHLLRSMPLFDVFGALSTALIPVLESIGCRKAIFLPMFFNEERLSKTTNAQGGELLASQIAFIGNGSIERAEALRHLVDYDLAIWGNWPDLLPDDPLRTRIRGNYLEGARYALAMKQTQIALNVLNMQCRGSHNTRTFEATGFGAFLLTEYSSEQAVDLFKEDKEIACFRSAGELKEKTAYYLLHETERKRIAAAGQARPLGEHTLRHRLERIVCECERLLPGRKAGG
jgi:spore maturation protein CgeB